MVWHVKRMGENRIVNSIWVNWLEWEEWVNWVRDRLIVWGKFWLGDKGGASKGDYYKKNSWRGFVGAVLNPFCSRMNPNLNKRPQHVTHFCYGVHLALNVWQWAGGQNGIKGHFYPSFHSLALICPNPKFWSIVWLKINRLFYIKNIFLN